MGKNGPAHMRTPEQRRRRRLIWGAGGAAAMAVVGAVVAYALLQLRADIDGGGNISAPSDLEFTAANVTTETGVDCQVGVAGGDLALQMADGVQGAQCDISMTLQRTGQTGPPQYIRF